MTTRRYTYYSPHEYNNKRIGTDSVVVLIGRIYSLISHQGTSNW